MSDSKLEHDTLDDRKSFKQPPANKMIEEPVLRKSARVKEMLRMREAVIHGERPHMHEDNPAIWDGEIE